MEFNLWAVQGSLWLTHIGALLKICLRASSVERSAINQYSLLSPSPLAPGVDPEVEGAGGGEGEYKEWGLVWHTQHTVVSLCIVLSILGGSGGIFP